MKPHHSFRRNLATIVLTIPLLTQAAHAASASWTGGGTDALWSNTANWSASPVPGTGETATFNAAAGAGGAVIDLGAGVTVNTISFVGPSFAAYTIGAGAVNSQSLTLNGSGNAGLVASGAASTAQITINAAITVNHTQQWILPNGANPWIFNGNVTPNGIAASTIQVKINNHGCFFNGVLADQVGGALLQMSGSNGQTATLTNANNSFTGGLVFDNGNVSVNSIGMIGANSVAGAGGPLLFGGGFGGGSLTYTGTGDTTDHVVTVNHGFNGPTLTQSGASGNLKYTADLAFSASTSAVGSALVTLTGSTNGTGEFSGKLVDNAATGFTPLKTGVGIAATSLVLHSVDGVTIGSAVTGAGFAPGTTVTAINTGTRTITISPATTGAVAQGANVSVGGLVNITYLTKSGSGTWTLSGANTHSGFTKISGGTLILTNSLALQNSPIDMVGSITGTASAGLKTTVATLSLGGLNGTASPKNLSNIFTTTSGGYNTVTALTLNPRAAASFSYSGIIADGAPGMTLTKTGAGTQILGGSNAYTGATSITGGSLILGASGSIATSASVSIGAAGTLDTSAQASYTAPATLAFGIDATGTGSSGKITAANLDVSGAAVTYNISGTPDDPVYVLATYTGSLVGTFASVPAPPTGYTLNYTYLGNSIALVATGSPYATFSGGAPFDGDANGDGVSNGLAFLLGAANINVSALDKLPTVTQSGGGLVLTFTSLNAASRGAATLNVQQSSDLGISDPWVTAPVPDVAGISGPVNGVTFNVTLGSPSNSVTATISSSESAAGKLFARLRATEN